MQTVEVRTDSRCGSCSAKGDVLVIMQNPSGGSHAWVSNFCTECFRELKELADRAALAFSNEHRRWPEVNGERVCIG